MHDISKIFERFKYKEDKLLKYGFKVVDNKYVLEKKSSNKAFSFHIEINNKKVSSLVIDNNTKEEYMPFYIESINGEYVGTIRDEFDLLLKDILEKCYEKDYENSILKKMIKCVRDKYDVKPEYLWSDSPNTFVFKHEGAKWFGIVMDIKYKKVGIPSDDIVYVLNVKNNDVDKVLKENGVVPAYHMNKKYWISILLDGSISLDKVLELIDISYGLTK